MKKFVLMTLLLIGFQLIYAHREDTYFLMGKIGNTDVGVQIDEHGKNAIMRYFKLSELKETVLDGTKDAQGQFVFRLQPSESRLHILLQEVELNVWKGTFHDASGDSLVIELEPIEVNNINHPYVEAVLKYKIDPYTALRTKSVKFTPLYTSRQKGGNKLVNLIDNLANVSSVRIEMEKGKQQADSINAYLVAQHLKHIQNALSCSVQEKPVYKLDYIVHDLTDSYISFSESVITNCLGGKLTTSTETFNKWMSSANDIMLEEILWFGESGKNNIRYGSQEWHQYRYKVLGDKLLHILSELYPDKFYRTDTGLCDYSNVKGWQFPKWHLLSKGVYFEYAILSKNAVCNAPAWSVVPWRKVKEYRIKNHDDE